MSATAYLDRASRWARRLEDDEAERLGMPVRCARTIVARRLRLAPGTLENLRKGRLKGIAAHVYAVLQREVAKALTKELEAHLAERSQLASDDLGSDANALAQVDASIATIRAALGLNNEDAA